MTTTASTTAAPAPYGPVPSARQLRWHRHAFYGFLHFTTNTFTGKAWCCKAAIGARRLIRGEKTTTRQLRFRVVDAPVCPAISELGVHCVRTLWYGMMKR